MRRTVRQVTIAAAGSVLILVGVVLSIPFVPGPGFLLIAAGIAVLAREFHWAKRLVIRMKQFGRRVLPESLAKRIHFSAEEQNSNSGIRE